MYNKRVWRTVLPYNYALEIMSLHSICSCSNARKKRKWLLNFICNNSLVDYFLLCLRYLPPTKKYIKCTRCFEFQYFKFFPPTTKYSIWKNCQQSAHLSTSHSLILIISLKCQTGTFFEYKCDCLCCVYLFRVFNRKLRERKKVNYCVVNSVHAK